ncbi:MAG: response regulator [Gammaproteobacteria bacterium]|nr:response regulator [Gammaproteobacteria bacterium]
MNQAMAVAELSAENREYLELIRAELEDITDDLVVSLEVLQAAAANPQPADTLLETLAEQAGHVANAARLIGLEGLAMAAEQIAARLGQLRERLPELTETQVALVATWPRVLAGYLDAFGEPQATDAVLNLLADPGWFDGAADGLDRPGEAAVATLRELLLNPRFAETEAAPARPVEVGADDVSLAVPEGVNPDLLDGLLQELPAQTELFTAAIQTLVEAGAVEELSVAQRIAHTIKGAGNVVGVRGVANLTHHLEDILAFLDRQQQRPPRQLGEALLRAADCLEAMSDALQGRDAEPADALPVLREVLDWARRIDAEGEAIFSAPMDETPPVLQTVDSLSSSPVAEPPVPTLTPEPETEQEEAATSTLRISSLLADELLRLSGEGMITVSQLQEQLQRAARAVRVAQAHNDVLHALASELEHLVDVRGMAGLSGAASAPDDFDPLEMDRYNELHSFSRRLVEAVTDNIELTRGLAEQMDDLATLVADQDQANRQTQETLLKTRMVPVSTIVPRLRRGVRQAARLTGKDIALELSGEDEQMDSEVLQELVDPLMHLLRNAIDHGIESPEQRRSLPHKPAQGQVAVGFRRQGDRLVVTVSDDGAGIDTRAVEQRARELGLIQGEAVPAERDLLQLVLAPGFSTRREVSQVSGRGIGLDAVNATLRGMKGALSIDSVPGEGARFELSIPVSRLSSHALLVRLGEDVHAVSTRGVEEILPVGSGVFERLGEAQLYRLGNEACAVRYLHDLIGSGQRPGEVAEHENPDLPVLLVRDPAGQRVAIRVDAVLDARRLVIKPLGPYVPRSPGLLGGTILGDGRVAPVIDLPELLQAPLVTVARRTAAEVATAGPTPGLAAETRPVALVVDDSLSARRSMAQFVRDMGFEVRAARDGMEAVELIANRRPDLIVADLEMPRMNGLELAAHLRNNESTRRLPFVMVTSRSTEKHRARARECGIEHYIVKPFGDEELLDAIQDAMEVAHA